MSMEAKITIWECLNASDDIVELWREISVERVQRGVTRVCVSFGYDEDEEEKTCGIDLTASECRQLASLLEAAAIGAETAVSRPTPRFSTAEEARVEMRPRYRFKKPAADGGES